MTCDVDSVAFVVGATCVVVVVSVAFAAFVVSVAWDVDVVGLGGAVVFVATVVAAVVVVAGRYVYQNVDKLTNTMTKCVVLPKYAINHFFNTGIKLNNTSCTGSSDIHGSTSYTFNLHISS